MDKQFEIFVQNQDYPRDRIYITLGFNFGFAISNYRNNEEIIKVNSSSLIFLAFCKKRYVEDKFGKKLEFEINPGTSILSVISTSKNFQTDFEIISEMISHEILEEEFDTLKEEFSQYYKKRYAEKHLILNYTLLEFLSFNKQFSRDDFHKQLEKLTFEDVIYVQKKLFNRSICKIHILGSIEEECVKKIEKHLIHHNKNELVEAVFFPLNERDLVAREIIINEEDSHKYLLIHNDLSGNSPIEVFLTFQIINEAYAKRVPIMSLDGADMGMVIPDIEEIREEVLESSKISNYLSRLQTQFEYLLLKKPRLFSKMFIMLQMLNIKYIDYYLWFKELSEEEVQNIVLQVLSNSIYCIVRNKEEKV